MSTTKTNNSGRQVLYHPILQMGKLRPEQSKELLESCNYRERERAGLSCFPLVLP